MRWETGTQVQRHLSEFFGDRFWLSSVKWIQLIWMWKDSKMCHELIKNKNSLTSCDEKEHNNTHNEWFMRIYGVIMHISSTVQYNVSNFPIQYRKLNVHSPSASDVMMNFIWTLTQCRLFCCSLFGFPQQVSENW